MNCRFHLLRYSAFPFNSFPNSLFCFTNHPGTVLFLFFSIPLSVLLRQQRRQCLFRICPIQLPYLRRILFRSLLFSPIRSRTSSLVTFTDNLISPLSSSPTFRISKYFCSNFLSLKM